MWFLVVYVPTGLFSCLCFPSGLVAEKTGSFDFGYHLPLFTYGFIVPSLLLFPSTYI